MTVDQWAKVIERARALSGSSDPNSGAFLDRIRQLTDPIDEAQLDTDNAIAKDIRDQARITQLEAELAALKR